MLQLPHSLSLGSEEMTGFDNEKGRALILVPDEQSLMTVSDFFDECLEDFELELKLGLKLKVIADEIYSNIVFYSGAKEAEVAFCDAGESVVLRFVDDGIAYNPLEAEEPDITDIMDREPGGLGLFMVKSMADGIAYEYVSGKNCLSVALSKRVEVQ